MIPLARYALELVDMLNLYRIVATTEFKRKEYLTSLHTSHMVVYMCSSIAALQELRLEMLKLAALSRMGLREYEEALQAWKLCFEQCLILDDRKIEIYIYE